MRDVISVKKCGKCGIMELRTASQPPDAVIASTSTKGTVLARITASPTPAGGNPSCLKDAHGQVG